MKDFDSQKLPQEFIDKQLDFYQMSLETPSNRQSTSSDQFQSPIYSELQSIKSHFSDKFIHAMGGMKVVCKVNDLRTGREIAIAEIKKTVAASQEEIEQFLREARITAALEHPNIVPIYDIGLDNKGKPFFTMKFMSDESLKKVIHELVKANPVYTEKYTQAMLLEIFLKVCDAIAYAHSRHVVHLDIKPDNIMIGEYGEVYICDWGLAKQLELNFPETGRIKQIYDPIFNDSTLTGMVKGTPGFMAPEQVDKKFGAKNEQTDIYSLGALLYTMLVLKRPYANLNVEQTLDATKNGELQPPQELTTREVPASLNAICMKAMARDQKERYQTVDELTADIRAYQEGFGTEAENITAFKALWLLLKRNRLLSVMIALVVLTGSIVGGVLGNMLERSEKQAAQKLQHKNIEVSKLHDTVSAQIERLKKFKELYASGIIAKWNMNETFGLEAYNELEEVTGTLHNGIERVKGYKKNGLKFDGKDDYVKFGNLRQYAYSITMWIKLEKEVNETTEPMSIIHYGPHDEDNIALGNSSSYASNETLTILGINPGTCRSYIRDKIPSGWHHFAFVWNNSTKRYKIFIDGKEKTVYKGTTGGHTPLIELTNLYLGYRFRENSWYFSGVIDEFIVYGRSLTDKEVAALSDE